MEKRGEKIIHKCIINDGEKDRLLTFITLQSIRQNLVTLCMCLFKGEAVYE